MKRPGFVGLILTSFDNAIKQHPENLLENILRNVRFTPIQALVLMFAFIQSKHPVIITDSIRFMRSILPSVSGNFQNEISDELLNGLLTIVTRHKVCGGIFGLYCIDLKLSVRIWRHQRFLVNF